MTAARAEGVVHACLEAAFGALPPGLAGITDQQRIAVLLQAAGLLSLLDRAGWAVADWSAARVSAEGRLVLAGGAAPGGPERQTQEVLRELLGRLFRYEGSAALAGRGPARRSARVLLDRWFQSLAPLAPDEAVGQILGDAPFLWEPAFGSARAALAGELVLERSALLWVAGPRRFRSLLLPRCPTLGELRELLAGPEARRAWEGEAGTVLAADSEAEKVEAAGALAFRGRTEAALAVLEGLRSPAAETVRARCQLHLAQLGAVRATLRRLAGLPLDARQAVELAEIAARVFANGGEPGRARPWIDKALRLARKSGSALTLRAGLVAAAAAWDRGDLAAMDRWLERTAGARTHPDPGLAWRWHHARGLRAEREPEQGAEAVAHVARALRLGRRSLSRHEAAGLWNDLGLARAKLGDLAGAERAFLHATRRLEGCDGPRKTTLALPNLAEIRLRRGRLQGVEEILQRTAAENRLAGNLRGLSNDLNLRARHELVLGRPEAALALCREALELGGLGELGEFGGYSEVSRLLAGRALGWLERPAEAAAELSLLSGGALEELEPEERPALRAHAGDREGALREAAGTPFAPLWQAALEGGAAPLPDWQALSSLEPYRAARLVFDLELAAPGCAPAPWLRSAAAALRRVGAPAAAARLEARDQGPWHALAAYLGRPPGDREAAAELLAQAGYPELRPVLTEAGAEGSGDPPDAPARALLALVARDARRMEREEGDGGPEEPADGGPERLPPAAGEMAGESPLLRAALERLDRLAPGEVPVLILGESGTGKELAARRVHRGSARARAPFLAVNCAALSETLILSDLFGHSRGAFTGADSQRRGVFETANGGTVFLDEIGDLPLSAQGLLLRVLQEGEVRPLGEPTPRKVNVRVLAATHRDLEAMVGERTFRQDLFFRLKVGSVVLPPLRDRGGDVLLLADRFLARRHPECRLSREARARLVAHPWPGNIRELQNVLSVAAALAGEGGLIAPGHLELPATEVIEAPEGNYHQQVEAFRRRLLLQAIADCGGNYTRVAKRLGLSRQSVGYLVRQLKLR